MIRTNYFWGLLALGILPILSSPLCAQTAPDSIRAAAAPDTAGGKDEIKTGGARGTPQPAEITPEERAQLKRTLQMMGCREVEGERLWQRRKSPKVAMYSNAVLPGLGQVYNGRRIKTVLMAGAASYYFGNIWLNQKSAQRTTALRDNLPPGASSSLLFSHNRLIEFYKEQAKDFLWWSAAVWILGILDAWIDAHLYDIRAYNPPATGDAAGGFESTPYVTLSISF